MSNVKLKDEVDTDPLSRGYSSMSDSEVVDSLNTKDISRNRSSMSGDEVSSSIDKTEYQALSDASKDRAIVLTNRIVIDPFGFVKDVLIDIFGGGSTTIASLAAARVESISRAEELKIGKVKLGHVEAIR